MINYNELCSIARPVAEQDADKVREIQTAVATYMGSHTVLYEPESELKVNLMSRSSLQRAFNQSSLARHTGSFRDAVATDAPESTVESLSVRMIGLRSFFDWSEQAHRIDLRLAADTLRAERAHYLARFVTGHAYHDQMRAMGSYHYSVLLGKTYAPKRLHNGQFRDLLRPALTLDPVQTGFTEEEMRNGAFVSTGTRTVDQAQQIPVRTVRPMPAGLLSALRG